MSSGSKLIGILALQGGFDAHARVLSQLGHRVRLVRAPEDLRGLRGLVLPGGESTVHLRLIERFGLEPALRGFFEQDLPILATCAGAILAARRVIEPAQPSLGWIDVTVKRNGWGRQLDSFEGRDDEGALPLVFIRAPRIIATSPAVKVLARLDGEPILIRQGSVVAATFHPELTSDLRLHAEIFGSRISGGLGGGAPQAQRDRVSPGGFA